MSTKKCKAAPKRRRDSMAAPVNLVDVLYHLPTPEPKEGEKPKKMVTILATMAAPY